MITMPLRDERCWHVQYTLSFLILPDVFRFADNNNTNCAAASFRLMLLSMFHAIFAPRHFDAFRHATPSPATFFISFHAPFSCFDDAYADAADADISGFAAASIFFVYFYFIFALSLPFPSLSWSIFDIYASSATI